MQHTFVAIALFLSVASASPAVNWANIPMEQPVRQQQTIRSRGPFSAQRRVGAPSKCCVPEAFEVRSHGHAVFHNVEGTILVGHMSQIAVDKRLRKMAENTTVYVEDRRPEEHDTVIDDRTHKIYYINRQRGCSTEHSIPPFEFHLCIPSEAEFNGEEQIGAGSKDEGVVAHTWRWRAEEPFEGREAAAVTEKDCTPIWRDMSGRNEREKFEVHSYNGFADFKEGIKNPSVFNVPKPCNEVMSPLELSDWLSAVEKAHEHYHTKRFF